MGTKFPYKWKYDYSKGPKMSDLVGQTFDVVERYDDDGEKVVFFNTELNIGWGLWHDQNCCEGVTLEEVIGDLDDLIGTPILEAREDSNHDDPPENEWGYESFTWTFYNLRTIKGSVTLRWFGESNGCYSESVDLHCLESE